MGGTVSSFVDPRVSDMRGRQKLRDSRVAFRPDRGGAMLQHRSIRFAAAGS
jgi:hypothetical protein